MKKIFGSAPEEFGGRNFPDRGHRRRLLLMLILMGQVLAVGAGVTTLPTGGQNIYRLTTGNLSGKQGDQQIIGTTYDCRVCAFSWHGETLRPIWGAALGGFAFSVAAGDPAGDGRDSVFAGSADGCINAFSGEGKLLWKTDLHAPVYQVAVVKTKVGSYLVAGTVNGQLVRLSAKGAVEQRVEIGGAIRALTAGDYDGDGNQELFIAGFARDDFAFARFLRLPALEPFSDAWRQPSLLAEVERADHGINAVAVDVFGHGKDVLVFQNGIIMPENSPQPVARITKAGPNLAYSDAYRMRIPVGGDFLVSHPGREVVIVNGYEVSLHTIPDELEQAAPSESAAADGIAFHGAGKKKLKAIKAAAQQSADKTGTDAMRSVCVASIRCPLSFSDAIAVRRHDRDGVLLASAPNGDDNLYFLAPDEQGEWLRQLGAQPWHGRIRDINAQITALGKTLTGWSGPPARGQDAPCIVITERRPKLGQLGEDFAAEMRWLTDTHRYYRERFPYPDRLRFAVEVEIHEQRPEAGERAARHGGGLSRDAILEHVIKVLERQGISWVARIGHAAQAFVSTETAEAMILAAPTTCIGFSTAEQHDGSVNYFRDDLLPVLDLCVKYWKFAYLNEKNTFWASHAGDEIQQMLLAPKYRDVIVPCAEDSNSRAPDLNAQARVGLFLTGRVSNWCCRFVADAFSFNRQWDWDPVMVGHPHLRALTTQASLGARHFMLSCAQRDEAGRPNLILDAGIAQFLHLLGKRVIAPPRPEQMKNVSPVVLNIPRPSARFAAAGTGGHDYEAGDITEGELVFGRLDNWWGMAPPAPTDLARVLWGRERQFGNHIPSIGHHGCGLVTLVPGAPARPLTSYPWWHAVWTTDGDTLAGENSVRAAEQKLLAAMERGAAELPFRIHGDVYYQLVEQDENTYHLYLVDPGLVAPAPRRATVTPQRPGQWIARDRISRESLGPVANVLSVEVPGGLLRILEIVRDPRPVPGRN